MTGRSARRLRRRLTPRRRGAFAPFLARDFRVLWAVIFLRSSALWLDQVARPVLIAELTGSALLLGAVLAARMAPNLLLGVFAGAIVDRYPRRRILVLSQTGNVLAAALLCILLAAGWVQAWHVIALAAVSGANIAFFQPARQAILPAMVPSSSIRSAVALSQTANTVTRIGGALLAGLLLEFADFSAIYGLMAAVYAAAALSALLIRADVEAPAQRERSDGSLLSQTADGFRWAVRTRRPLAVLGVSVLLFIFIVPYQGVFLPLLVIDELREHASWVGYMMAAGGAGAVAGSLILAAARQLPATRRLMASLLVAAGIVLALLSFAPSLPLVALCVFAAVACTTNVMSLANLALLRLGREGMAGRAVSLMNFARGMIPLGALIAGALADALGPRTGLLAVAAAATAVSLAVLLSPIAGQASETPPDSAPDQPRA